MKRIVNRKIIRPLLSPSIILGRNPWLQKTYRPVHTNIGIFGDVHFQDNGLDRVIQTGDWIFEQFKQRNVSAIVCLGDVLNTRETVSVQSQSAAIDFFAKLSTLNVPIHILLGNHDINLTS
jgi:predicted phosphodiesterase